MGNGASLLSPGKSRRQRAQPADAPVEATVAVNAADKNPEQANKEEAPIAKKEDTQIVGIESPELELNDLAHELEDAGEFISFKGSPIEFLKQAGGDPYSDYSLALALEMEQDFQHARCGGVFFCSILDAVLTSNPVVCSHRCAVIQVLGCQHTTTSQFACCLFP